MRASSRESGARRLCGMMMGRLFVARHSARRWVSSVEGFVLYVLRGGIEVLGVWVAGGVVSVGVGVLGGAMVEAGRSEGLVGRCCDD
jgi:hypothetical protein